MSIISTAGRGSTPMYHNRRQLGITITMAKASTSSVSKSKKDKSSVPAPDRAARHLATITSTESTLLSSAYNPNPLLTLLSLTREDEPEVVHKSIWALYRVFIKFLEEGKLTRVSRRSQAEEEEQGQGKENVVAEWVEGRLKEYVEVLCGLLWDAEGSLRVSPFYLWLEELNPN
jgi:U3 small nucleolar RNA-associated protein 19